MECSDIQILADAIESAAFVIFIGLILCGLFS